jgi:hypothetical protein
MSEFHCKLGVVSTSLKAKLHADNIIIIVVIPSFEFHLDVRLMLHLI